MASHTSALPTRGRLLSADPGLDWAGFDPATGEFVDDPVQAIAEQALGANDDGPQFTRLHPEMVQQAYTKLGLLEADLKAAANLLEEMRRPIRARKARAYRKGGLGVAESEVAAEASQEYADHLEAMVEARRLADRAKVRLESFRVAWETARTVAATERNAMKM